MAASLIKNIFRSNIQSKYQKYTNPFTITVDTATDNGAIIVACRAGKACIIAVSTNSTDLTHDFCVVADTGPMVQSITEAADGTKLTGTITLSGPGSGCTCFWIIF